MKVGHRTVTDHYSSTGWKKHSPFAANKQLNNNQTIPLTSLSAAYTSMTARKINLRVHRSRALYPIDSGSRSTDPSFRLFQQPSTPTSNFVLLRADDTVLSSRRDAEDELRSLSRWRVTEATRAQYGRAQGIEFTSPHVRMTGENSSLKFPCAVQSYWAMLRVLGHNLGMQVLGDMPSFTRNARLWRISLDRIRDVIHSKPPPTEYVVYEEEAEDDSIIGRYIWIDSPGWGKSKVFCESAGAGPQHILFLHTAGADSRQFHPLMNNRQLQRRCTMFAFDLPGHGRSYPGSKTHPEGFVNDEEQYVGAIKQVIDKLKLHRPIVSGASMGGQVCLAVALHAKELGVSGVIPCEACDHLPLTQPIYHLPGDQNETILNAERVCGMISPTAPTSNKKLIWWTYSSQGTQMFHGDLKFYFQGWDGRERMHLIDTKTCPVYMLTGEYDYSCTPQMSQETAKKIPGAKFEVMKDLGHFPMSENPTIFLKYFVQGLEYISSVCKSPVI
ncbi:predicted protein [Uncinocarpus reesii 1704]|uniref:AB hydrolase-1 domain-containing protein n=1 Tax=Uncinocarpus reesii (strain UAMH 1704) TaxID=336963 RepID=C4JH44_UNCRE|nr:uncharacterized protein UREG_02617 [Uncinocarpus reesii 1704]EEP77768.1 predicted protein [Uncinocarpus reesii 1704]